MTNIINPSFELSQGTYKVPSNNSSLFPNGWKFWWADGSTPRVDADKPKGQGLQDMNFDPPEILPKSYLSYGEGRALVEEGDDSLKGFKGGAPTWFRLWQAVQFENAKHNLSIKIFPDQVINYQGGKRWVREGDSSDWYLASEVCLRILPGDIALPGDPLPNEWLDGRVVGIGRWNVVQKVLETTGGIYTIVVDCRGRWGFPNNGWFLDDVRCDDTAVTPPVIVVPPTPPTTVQPGTVQAVQAVINETDAALAGEQEVITQLRGRLTNLSHDLQVAQAGLTNG